MIKITDRLSFKPDHYGYKLTEIYQTQDNKTKQLQWNEDGSPKLSSRDYFFANIDQIINKVIFLAGSDTVTGEMENLRTAWYDCVAQVKKCLEGTEK